MTDDFTRHIVRLIAANVAQQKGFASISEAALDVFADAIIQRLTDYAASSASAATRAGRTDVNGIDVFSGLSRYDETPASLAAFLRDADPIPPFEYLIDPYPLPVLPRFYATFAAPPQTNTPIPPFRANTTFSGTNADRNIPSFFPAFPKQYTYDHTIVPDPPMHDDPDIVKKREADQNRTKQALQLILPGRGADAPQSGQFACELTQLPQSEWLSMPTPLLDSPAYQVEGARTRHDPEFPPLIEMTEAMVASDATRDIPALLAILSIKQGTSEPGTLKNATYNPTGTSAPPEKERVSSPPSSS
jgi:hypothetical protein